MQNKITFTSPAILVECVALTAGTVVTPLSVHTGLLTPDPSRLTLIYI